MHFLNIDMGIDIAIFRQYHIDVVSKSKKWYRRITSRDDSVPWFPSVSSSSLWRRSRHTTQYNTKLPGRSL